MTEPKKRGRKKKVVDETSSLNFDEVKSPEIVEVVEKPPDINQELLDLGYDFEVLPSGKVNIRHANKFRFNGLIGTFRNNKWFHTVDCSINNIKSKIVTLEFI